MTQNNRNQTIWISAVLTVERLYDAKTTDMIAMTYESKTIVEKAEMVVRGVMDKRDYVFFCFWRQVSQVYNDYARSGNIATIEEFQTMLETY